MNRNDSALPETVTSCQSKVIFCVLGRTMDPNCYFLDFMKLKSEDFNS